MNTYCLSCKKDTKNIDSKVIKTKNNRKMMLSRCLFIVLADPLLDTKKELKNLNKLVIRVIFIEMNLIKLVFNTILLMQITKI